jgi:hypothetical protein
LHVGFDYSPSFAQQEPVHSLWPASSSAIAYIIKIKFAEEAT